MIAHVALNVSNFERSRKFYETVLKPLGYKLSMKYEKDGGFNDGKNTDFWLHEEKAKTPTHIAFEAATRKQVDDFYTIALKAGAKDNGEPDLRPDYGDNYYAAYVFDPDGNNVEVACFGEE